MSTRKNRFKRMKKINENCVSVFFANKNSTHHIVVRGMETSMQNRSSNRVHAYTCVPVQRASLHSNALHCNVYSTSHVRKFT